MSTEVRMRGLEMHKRVLGEKDVARAMQSDGDFGAPLEELLI